MQTVNVILVYNHTEDRILMCLRAKEPYKGLYNLVGGKVKNGEAGIDAAYRELEEETGITKADIELTHLMDLKYCIHNYTLQVFAGKLNKGVILIDEDNSLYWHTLDNNFFDMSRYAGEGNIGHMIEQVNLHKNEIFYRGTKKDKIG